MGTKKKKKTRGVVPFEMPSKSTTNASKLEYGDTSKEVEESEKLQEERLDEKLSALQLVRKKIPKDGACLFRAVADSLTHSFLSQMQHFQIRQYCVDFMEQNREDYEPFICISGLPFDHYCFEMRKVHTWGGQVELQVLSLLFKINFVIYSLQTVEPTVVDNGFARSVNLAYYGHHYDVVYTKSIFDAHVMCQEILFDTVNLITGHNASTTYKNVGWECWVNQLQAQEKEDSILAQSLSKSYQYLSGYYVKPEVDAELFFDMSSFRPKAKKKHQLERETLTFYGSPSGNQKDSISEDPKPSKSFDDDISSFPALPTIEKSHSESSWKEEGTPCKSDQLENCQAIQFLSERMRQDFAVCLPADSKVFFGSYFKVNKTIQP